MCCGPVYAVALVCDKNLVSMLRLHDPCQPESENRGNDSAGMERKRECCMQTRSIAYERRGVGILGFCTYVCAVGCL